MYRPTGCSQGRGPHKQSSFTGLCCQLLIGGTWGLMKRAGVPTKEAPSGAFFPAVLFPELAKSHESANWRSIFKARPLPSLAGSSKLPCSHCAGKHCKRRFLFPLFNGASSGSLEEARCELEDTRSRATWVGKGGSRPGSWGSRTWGGDRDGKCLENMDPVHRNSV